MSFRKYINEQKEMDIFKEKISGLLFLYTYDNLNESNELITEGFEKYLNKLGFKIKKGDGIIQYILKFTSGAGKLLLAALKGDKEEVKDIAKSLTKEKVIDFLLKLDLVTLHIFSEPIHFISALTGWELEANIEALKSKAADLIYKLKNAFDEVKQAVSSLFQHEPDKLQAVNNFEKSVISPITVKA